MTLNSPTFTKINETFICQNCHVEVPKAQQTCRDHCPNCLYSIHVDNNPGDRAAECFGLLTPVSWSQNKKKGYMIHYVCKRCGMEKVNRFLEHDTIQADNFSALLSLASITKMK